MKTLSGKIALVTGGNSGIGYATARELAAQGATVLITGRNAQAVGEAAAGLGVAGMVSDQSKMADIEALAEHVKTTYGHLDILFINAGVAFFAPVEMATEAHFDDIMNINMRGAYFTLSKLIPVLREGAAVTFLTSVNATSGMSGTSVYAASKAALHAVVQVAATELAPRKIRVNAVSPGPVNTPIFAKTGMDAATLDGFAHAAGNRVPLKRFGESEEVAHLVAFLSGDHARFITGGVYPIDGGIGINSLMG